MSYMVWPHGNHTWITYERQGDDVAVSRNDQRIGVIRPHAGGFQFLPAGEGTGGPVHESVRAVKREIER